MWLNIWIINSCCFFIILNSFNKDFWGLLLQACAVEIVKHVSFVFQHPKNTIPRSPSGVSHIVHPSSKDLTQKLLLLRRLPFCLPASSILKLRLPQFFFIGLLRFFPWSVANKSNSCNTLPVLRYLFVHLSDTLLKIGAQFLESYL